jgi:hypothetical protein
MPGKNRHHVGHRLGPVGLARRPDHAVYGFLFGMVALKILDRT